MDTFGPLTHLGRYQIVRQLGRGSMGVVYEALDPRLNRPVAIKTILKGHLLDEALANEYTVRFQREAQAVGRLAHPNIVTLYDFGEESEVTYIVMEFIRGRELAAHFEAGEYFDLRTAVRIMGELLDALAYAHDRGIVHRDVKPANVMIDQAGHVKLTDFGVARVTDSNLDRTQPGTMVGTPSYMSPEQILGLSVGSRADLFAAGVVLYQFLAHDKPFKGNGPWDVQRKIVNDHPPAPSTLNSQVTPAFDAIVARALAKKPEDRYPDAATFAADIRQALADMPLTALDMDLLLDLSAEVAPPAPEAKPAAPPPPRGAAAATSAAGASAAAALKRSPITDAGGGATKLPMPSAPPRQPGAARQRPWLVAWVALSLCAIGVAWWWWPGATPAPREPAAVQTAPTPAPAPVAPEPAPTPKPTDSPVAKPSTSTDSPARSLPSPPTALPDATPSLVTRPSASPSTSEPVEGAAAMGAAPVNAAAPSDAKAADTPPPVGAPKATPMDPRPMVRQNGSPSARRGPADAPTPSAERRSLSPRCADLLQQAQLGETLSPQSLEFLRKECRQ